MLSVYIETTIPSYYTETRRTPQVLVWREITRKWWDNYRHDYRLCTSRFVLAELLDAPPPKSRRAIDLLRHVSVLDEPKQLAAVADYYITQRAMPAEAGGDAFHLAIVSLHRIDFLLTWNCRHLANANKIRLLTVLTLMPEDRI